MRTTEHVVETDRLRLREMSETDMPALSRILQDSEVMYAYEHAFSDEEVRRWYEKQAENYRRYGFGLWAVVLKQTEEMIGQCGLTMQAWNTRTVPEIGYHLAKTHWHRGYAIEAARACKRYAFECLGIDEVFSIIRDNNIASMNVAIRNGMEIRGSFAKHYRNIDMPHLVFSAKAERRS